MNIDEKKFYKLFDLPYAYDALVPYISEKQLKIHHQKHHQGYATGVNTAFKKWIKLETKM
ncbi:MAG: hypothetical protein U9P70_02645 [Patescibacteria group bacterium]|nr:hypothetical protein [Patescibacteria group bacterium]